MDAAISTCGSSASSIDENAGDNGELFTRGDTFGDCEKKLIVVSGDSDGDMEYGENPNKDCDMYGEEGENDVQWVCRSGPVWWDDEVAASTGGRRASEITWGEQAISSNLTSWGPNGSPRLLPDWSIKNVVEQDPSVSPISISHGESTGVRPAMSTRDGSVAGVINHGEATLIGDESGESAGGKKVAKDGEESIGKVAFCRDSGDRVVAWNESAAATWWHASSGPNKRPLPEPIWRSVGIDRLEKSLKPDTSSSTGGRDGRSSGMSSIHCVKESDDSNMIKGEEGIND
jgi:hypothetical protein